MFEGKEFCIEANGRRITDYYKDYKSVYSDFMDMWERMYNSDKFEMISSQWSFVTIDKDDRSKITLWAIRSC